MPALNHDGLPERHRDADPRSTYFILGGLQSDERAAFAAELARDHELRQATIAMRSEVPAEAMPVSDRAAWLLDLTVEAVRHGNSFFPALPAMAGYEGDAGVIEVRAGWYSIARDYAVKLLLLGELEDLAHENMRIALHNQNLARRHDLHAAGGEAPAASETLHSPVRLHCAFFAPAPLPAQAALAPLLTPAEVVPALHTLGLGEENQSAAVFSIFEPFHDRERVECLLSALRSNHELRAAICRYLEQPIRGALAETDVAGKLVAAKLLLAERETAEAPEVVQSLAEVLRCDLGRLIEGSLSGFAADRLHAVAQLVAAASDLSERLWAAVKEPLLLTLESNHAAAPRDAAPHRRAGLVEALGRMPRRIRSDERLQSLVAELARSPKMYIASAALAAAGSLPPEQGIPLLCELCLRPADSFDREDGEIEGCGAYPAAVSRCKEHS